MNKFICFFVLIIFSCQNNTNRNGLKNAKKSSEKRVFIKDNEDSLKYYIVRIDSVKMLYFIYAKKGKSYYKIISEKLKKPSIVGEKLKLYKNYNLDITSIVPDTSKLKSYTKGVLYEETDVLFEGDSIKDLYISPQIKGLYYNEK